MNKYKIILDMLKNKILFIFKRYKYNDNKTLTFENVKAKLYSEGIIDFYKIK